MKLVVLASCFLLATLSALIPVPILRELLETAFGAYGSIYFVMKSQDPSGREGRHPLDP